RSETMTSYFSRERSTSASLPPQAVCTSCWIPQYVWSCSYKSRVSGSSSTNSTLLISPGECSPFCISHQAQRQVCPRRIRSAMPANIPVRCRLFCEEMKRNFPWLVLSVLLAGCALVPEYKTPISEEHEEMKEKQEDTWRK